jgi:hypothetical protein
VPQLAQGNIPGAIKNRQGGDALDAIATRQLRSYRITYIEADQGQPPGLQILFQPVDGGLCQ